MSLVVNGELIRAEASIGWRADDVPMLYAGKEHSIYAETESGKTWMEALLTKQALERGMSVAVIDFEEGDQGEWGNRLLAMGLEGRLMTAESFRYATPSSADATLALVNDLLTYPPDLVIYEGVSSAFGLFGLKIEDNNSAVEYRARLIKPLLDNGVATLSSDHVTKSAEGRGRYAIGGVAKLNMVNGVAYTLEAYISIVKGQEGCSLIYVTKDRPGSVKPAGTATGVPGKTRFGSMIVRGGDLTDEPLDVFIAPPPDHVEDHELTLDDQVLRAVYALPDHTAGSMTKLLAACRGAGIQRHNSALEAAVADLVHQGRMAEGVGRSNATTFTATIPSDEDLLDRL